jgi:hypothetical protein
MPAFHFPLARYNNQQFPFLVRWLLHYCRVTQDAIVTITIYDHYKCRAGLPVYCWTVHRSTKGYIHALPLLLSC